MKRLIIVTVIFLSLFFIGCKSEEPLKETEKGVATNHQTSKYNIKFENIMVDKVFKRTRVYIDGGKDIEIDISRPIKNIYQRDFDKDGRDELLIATEPNKNGDYFNFGVWTLDKDLKTEEIFYGDGSLSLCDYWFLTEDNKLIHLNSIRDYANEENAVYKSRYTCIEYTPIVKNNKLIFEQGYVKKTKHEMDNLKEIRELMGIPENAVIISNVSVD